MLKRFVPVVERSSFCSSGSHAFVRVERERRSVRKFDLDGVERSILKIEIEELTDCCEEKDFKMDGGK